jgi:Arc/MetJ-type ribon-helix-helix transcriptional regulator
MSNETEKLTINLGVVELAQIDVLVEQGIYANRSDFIRTAIRKDIDNYSERIQQQLTPIASKKEWEKVLGIMMINKNTLESLKREGQKANISVIGMLIIHNDVCVQLFNQTIEQIIVRGKIVAPNELKKIIHDMT